jgi:hypothetical protein
MAAELKRILHKKAEEECKKQITEIDEGFERLKTTLLKFAKIDKWDYPVSVEGASTNFREYERSFQLLEKSNLLTEKIGYTERTSYRRYELTEKGRAVLEKLKKESS